MDKQIIEKAKDRLEVLDMIEKLEIEGKFDIDAEKDPPAPILNPEDIEYIKEKKFDKVKSKFAYSIASLFVHNQIKRKQLVIKEIKGIENLQKVKTGAILTCNHFNPFDVFTIEKVFRISKQSKERKLYKVIREGNYTNFPGFYGFLFKNCDTLPLSSNKRTMVKFLKAVKILLEQNNFILIYPEQSLWWNYRKPKPLKNGAYKIATDNNIPIIPIFITMEDSEKIGKNGFPIQKYTVNIEEPIYKKNELSNKDNIEYMKNKNYEIWKNIYEKFYGQPLEYKTKKEEITSERK